MRAALLVAASTAGAAHAQNPIEVEVAAELVKGHGHLGELLGDVQDVSGPGGGVEARVGWRVWSSLVIGGYGGYARHTAGSYVPDGTDVHDGSAGVFAELHATDRHLPRPLASWRPWLGISTGWRGLWLGRGDVKSTVFHAWEIGRVQVGIERHVAASTFFGPVVGVAATMFILQDSPQTTKLATISDRSASLFVFAGVQMRFSAE